VEKGNKLMRVSKRGKFYPLAAQRVAAVIYFFLNGHTRGLEIMLGQDPFPDAEELALMADALNAQINDLQDLGTRIQKSGIAKEEQRIVESAEVIENIVKGAGGIKRFASVFNRYKKRSDEKWRALVDWYKYVAVRSPGERGNA
jgi:hypothetical protein